MDAIVGLVIYFTKGIPKEHLLAFILFMLPGGPLIVAFQIFRHRLYVSQMGYGNSEDVCFLKQMRTIHLNLPVNRADELCVQSLSGIPRCRVNLRTRYTNKIIAYAGIDISYVGWLARNLFFVSLGEKISFDIVRIDNNNTQIVVRSSPRYPIFLQPVDYGKNLRNVESIMRSLRKNNPKQ